MPSTTRCWRRAKMATPTVAALTTCTKNAPAAPSHTASGRPRVAMTRLANMVLSGSSPMKMTGKTARAIAGSTAPSIAAVGRVYDEIDDHLRTFMGQQPLFFVATAPLSGDGHVNLSPKGMRGTFAVLGSHRVAYLDLTGSGAETIAHLRENGRITIMFCAFDGPPRIVRLFGRGEAVLAGD